MDCKGWPQNNNYFVANLCNVLDILEVRPTTESPHFSFAFLYKEVLNILHNSELRKMFNTKFAVVYYL